MNPVKHTPPTTARKHAAGAVFLCIYLMISAPASAQSADAFIAAPEEKSDQSAEEEAQPDPVDDTPSRFAGKDIGPYTASRAAAFSMGKRDTDPFGLNQDPTVKPVARKAAANAPAKRQAALPPTPLSDIIKLIRVTTIMPGERKFLVGVRSFSESDEFAMIFQGKPMNMKVVEVSARSILFRNLDNGETAALETGMLPPGMMAGGAGLRPPGVVSTLKDLPLELGSDTPPETSY